MIPQQNWTHAVSVNLTRQNWRPVYSEPEPEIVRFATFELFGLPSTASFAECKRAYHRRMLEVHPDRGGTHAQAIALNLAFERLRDSF